jgi:branched-chain amino acid transport system permease protein
MIRPAFRRDHPPGIPGTLGAIGGPLLVVGLVTLIASFVYSDPTMTEIVLLFGINAIMVVGFQVFVGNTGIVSFGHIAFMAMGAYGAGIAAIPVSDKEIFLPDLPGFLAGFEVGIVGALLVGGAAAAVLALVTGVALMRLSGAAASIATLGLLVIINNVLAQATPITRGPRTLFGVPDNTTFFWVFASLAVVVCISAAFKWSKAGLRARAARDDPIAAESAGVPVLRARLWAFVLSAFITGIGGGLYAMLLTAFSPASFYIPQLVVVITMAIIGGINSITGAVTGAAVITVLTEFLRRVEDGVDVVGFHLKAATGISAAVLGIALILMLRWRPEGLLGAAELQFERPRGGPTPALQTAPAGALDQPGGSAAAGAAPEGRTGEASGKAL